MDEERDLTDAIIMFSVIIESAVNINFAESFLMFKDISDESNDFYLDLTSPENEGEFFMHLKYQF